MTKEPELTYMEYEANRMREEGHFTPPDYDYEHPVSKRERLSEETFWPPYARVWF